MLVNLGANNDVTITSGSVTADTELTTADLDTGAGTDTRAVVGLAGTASGGAQLIPGSSTDGLLVNLGANNDVTVTGTVTVDGSGVTQPVSHTALTELAAAIDTEVQVDVVGALPAGDNNIGNVDLASAIPAGTNNIGDVDVLSVVPGTGATALGKPEDGAHTTGDTGVLALAVRRDSAAVGSDTDGDYSTLNVDASGRLHVNVGNSVTVASHAVTNAGTFAVQVDGSALTALQLIDDPVFSDDAAFTPGTSKVMMIGAQADEASVDSVNEGDAGAVRMTLDRKLYVHVAPNDTDGLSIFRTLDADETEEDIKTSAGKLYGWYLYNDGAAEVYVKFYNATAANTTVGSTTPILTIPVPAGSAANVEFTNGITFGTALCIAATTGVADADSAAPAANQVVANVFYK
jgi:hypothetical protein